MTRTRRQQRMVRMLSPLRDFLATEASGGLLLVGAAVVALVWANSPWSASYHRLWDARAAISVAGHTLSLDLRHWLNDGLMTVFFFVVGLEIKREMTHGHLSNRRAAMLPIVAAIGGMVVPALCYVVIAGRTDPGGWAVPMATDIALAVGVMALAGASVSASARAFLLGLAVVDDIAAIVVIAVFFSTGVSVGWLVGAAAAVAAAAVIRWFGVQATFVYVMVGCMAWFALHEGGVHPTLAGVAMGLLAPSTPRTTPDLIDVEELNDLTTVHNARASTEIARSSVSTVEWLEHVLHPWTSYVIVPLFALANSGIEISRPMLHAATSSPIAWGVLVGLVIGKPVGVIVSTRLGGASPLAELPAGLNRRTLLGVGQAAGIGFTVAMFIAELAFDDDAVRAQAKLAILVASVVSAALATLVLRTGVLRTGVLRSARWMPRSSRTR